MRTQLLEKLEEIKEDIKKKIPSEKEERKKVVDLERKRHEIRNNKVRLNDTIGENRELIKNIDIMRQELTFAKLSIEAITN